MSPTEKGIQTEGGWVTGPSSHCLMAELEVGQRLGALTRDCPMGSDQQWVWDRRTVPGRTVGGGS